MAILEALEQQTISAAKGALTLKVTFHLYFSLQLKLFNYFKICISLNLIYKN